MAGLSDAELERRAAQRADAARNQCMGCQAGWPLERTNHRAPDGGLVACTADRYRADAERVWQVVRDAVLQRLSAWRSVNQAAVDSAAKASADRVTAELAAPESQPSYRRLRKLAATALVVRNLQLSIDSRLTHVERRIFDDLAQDVDAWKFPEAPPPTPGAELPTPAKHAQDCEVGPYRAGRCATCDADPVLSAASEAPRAWCGHCGSRIDIQPTLPPESFRVQIARAADALPIDPEADALVESFMARTRPTTPGRKLAAPVLSTEERELAVKWNNGLRAEHPAFARLVDRLLRGGR